jgi:hypothetical protein
MPPKIRKSIKTEAAKPEAKTETEAVKTEEEQYIEQLPDWEKKTLAIAKEHLKTSFDLQKSNGFLEWKRKQGSLPNHSLEC